MKQLKRTLSLAMSIVMLLSMCVTANAAYTPAHTEDADILYELGLFKGMGTDANGNPIYGLEQKATRIQGIVMLLHLLGEEAEAKAFEGTHPFTDVPEWGNKHVAYAYAKGYTAGTSATTFGSNDALLGKAYATFVLKALGYDANSDFSYDTALEKATELGLIQTGTCDAELLRDHCVMMSRNALRTNMKDSDQKLVEKLVGNGVISAEAVQTSCILNNVVYIPYYTDGGKKYILTEDICAVIPNVAATISSGNNNLSGEIQCKQIEIQKNLLVSNRNVKDYVSGDSNSLQKPIITKKLSLYGAGSIVVMDKDYNLIAYYVYNSINKDEKTLPFTTCFVEGKPEIERVRTLLKNVKTYELDSLFYKETITTINLDGTETSVSYLRMDENKLPSELNENAIYFNVFSVGKGNTYNLSLLNKQTSLYKYMSNSDGNNFTKIGDNHEFSDSYLKYEKFSVVFYDKNKDLIAIVTQSQPITANEIKTVIDLRES